MGSAEGGGPTHMVCDSKAARSELPPHGPAGRVQQPGRWHCGGQMPCRGSRVLAVVVAVGVLSLGEGVQPPVLAGGVGPGAVQPACSPEQLRYRSSKAQVPCVQCQKKSYSGVGNRILERGPRRDRTWTTHELILH